MKTGCDSFDNGMVEGGVAGGHHWLLTCGAPTASELNACFKRTGEDPTPLDPWDPGLHIFSFKRSATDSSRK